MVEWTSISDLITAAIGFSYEVRMKLHPQSSQQSLLNTVLTSGFDKQSTLPLLNLSQNLESLMETVYADFSPSFADPKLEFAARAGHTLGEFFSRV